MKTKSAPLVLPAIRCRMGDWIYYVTSLSFSAVAERISPATEIHKSESLSGWIQRQLDDRHAELIAQYLHQEDERLFNSIVVGVYEGRSRWASLTVQPPNRPQMPSLNEEQVINLERSLGILELSGRERLFAIDGQHRVSGIKRALAENPTLAAEEIASLFVAHQNTPEGIERTRRLFTTLNKTARKASTADIVALDEDDAFAVIARRTFDESTLFRADETKTIALRGNSAIPASDRHSITSIIGLYELAQDLSIHLFGDRTRTAVKKLKRARPDSTSLQDAYEGFIEYWQTLCEKVPAYKEVLKLRTKLPGDFRMSGNQNLLFRPVGQRAFAGCISTLISRGKPIRASVEKLVQCVNFNLEDPIWDGILWDRLQGNVLTNRTVAEELMLQQIGEPQHRLSAASKLDRILTEQKRRR